MRVLVIGAGSSGARLLQQLQKNASLEIVVVDAVEDPYAVKAGIIEKVDILETVSPLTLDYIVSRAQPEMIFLARSSRDFGLGQAPGLDMLADAIRDEISSIAEVPVIEVG